MKYVLQEKEYPALLSAGGGGRGVGTTMSSRDLRAVHIQELTLVKKKNTRIPETLNDGRVGCGAVCSTALGTSWGLGGRGGSRSHTGRLYLRTYDRILNSARSLVEEEFPAPDEGGWVQCEHHDEQHQGPGAPRACRRVATTEYFSNSPAIKTTLNLHLRLIGALYAHHSPDSSSIHLQ